MKYYHWVEHGRQYRSYYDPFGALFIEIEEETNGTPWWREIYCLSQTAIRGVLNLAKIDHDVARLGEG